MGVIEAGLFWITDGMMEGWNVDFKA